MIRTIEDILHVYSNTWGQVDFDLGDATVEVDLGCGKGGFLLQLAERYPERRIIGVDVMIGRLRRVAKKIRHRELANATLARCGGAELAGYLMPDNSIDRIHVLNPDPWPKARHRARRLVQSEFLGRLATKIKIGGILHLSTDDAPYFEFMQEAIRDLTCYAPAPDAIADIEDLKTDFEREYLAVGKPVPHLAFRRNA